MDAEKPNGANIGDDIPPLMNQRATDSRRKRGKRKEVGLGDVETEASCSCVIKRRSKEGWSVAKIMEETRTIISKGQKVMRLAGPGHMQTEAPGSRPKITKERFHEENEESRRQRVTLPDTAA